MNPSEKRTDNRNRFIIPPLCHVNPFVFVVLICWHSIFFRPKYEYLECVQCIRQGSTSRRIYRTLGGISILCDHNNTRQFVGSQTVYFRLLGYFFFVIPVVDLGSLPSSR